MGIPLDADATAMDKKWSFSEESDGVRVKCDFYWWNIADRKQQLLDFQRLPAMLHYLWGRGDSAFPMTDVSWQMSSQWSVVRANTGLDEWREQIWRSKRLEQVNHRWDACHEIFHGRAYVIVGVRITVNDLIDIWDSETRDQLVKTLLLDNIIRGDKTVGFGFYWGPRRVRRD